MKWQSLILVWAWCAGAEAGVPVVHEGQARALVVLPSGPAGVARYAAQEWVEHVRKASGVTLTVVEEGREPPWQGARIFLGPTRAAREAGIEAEALSPDSFFLRTSGDRLFVCGRDGLGKPLEPDTWAGTLFGVYEILEEVLGVRWLWPGDLGTHVPLARSIVIPDLDRTESPRLVIRRLRSTLDNRPGLAPEDGFSPAALRLARESEAVWLRRQRMGHSRRMRWGHAFTTWWEQHGQKHPDWFNLLEDGRRGPQYGNRGDRTALCVSHPGLQEQIIANWLRDCAAFPENKPNINGCENDVFGRCRCERCRSWDVPRPDEALYAERFSKHGIVSDRYARFWRTLQEAAARHDPEAIVAAYAYVNYAPPPLREKLNPQVWIGLVPDAFFPRSAAEQEQCLAMWDGWAATGCRLFLRPNYTLEGYCMPFLYPHQFAGEFAHHAGRGMIATDFDSLTAMWATQGPQLYLLARWQSCLEKKADEVLAEYYSGFGRAAGAVKDYFDEWERYTMGSRERFRAAEERWKANWALYPRMAHECFPPASFQAGYRRLDVASSAAGDDALARSRVEFLRKGLIHAEKCTALSQARAGNDFLAAQEALARLRAYRREIERDQVANLSFCAWIESRAFGEAKRAVIYTGQPLQPIPGEWPAGAPQPVSLRGEFGFLARLESGEPFRASVSLRRVAKNESPATWSLVGPDREKLGSGTVAPGQTCDISVPVRQAGIANLLLTSGGHAAGITLHNRHAVVLGQELALIHASGPLWFYVPPQTKSFTLTLRSPAPGETVSLAVLDPEGGEAARAATGREKEVVLEVPVAPGQDGRAWSVAPSRAPSGVLEDYSIRLGGELPPYWALGPGRLLVPAPSSR